MSFILPINLFHRNVEIENYIVATDKISQLNHDLNLEVELKPFMVGKILKIINENHHLILVEIFP